MTKTFKEYVKEKDLLKDCLPVENFRKRVSEENDPFLGDICFSTIFSNYSLHSADYNCKAISNFEKLLNDYGNWNIEEKESKKEDEAFAPIEDTFEYKKLKLVSPNKQKIIFIAFFYCGDNQNARYERKGLIIAFNSLQGFKNFIYSHYTVLKGNFDFNGNYYTFNATAQLLSDTLTVAVKDKEGGKWSRDDEYFFELEGDTEGIAEELTEIMLDFFYYCEGAKVSHLNYQYVNETAF